MHPSGAIDLQTALARLLCDATLRRRFARAPEAVAAELQVDGTERDAFVQLRSEELETQALILLRKRFEVVRRLLPRTVAQLGATAWMEFRSALESHRPSVSQAGVQDAAKFCLHLDRVHPGTSCRAEANRVRFRSGNHQVRVHWVLRFPVRGRARPAVQILFRSGGSWRELTVTLGE